MTEQPETYIRQNIRPEKGITNSTFCSSQGTEVFFPALFDKDMKRNFILWLQGKFLKVEKVKCLLLRSVLNNLVLHTHPLAITPFAISRIQLTGGSHGLP